MAEAIRIVGLKEFTRNLRKLSGDLPKLVRLTFNFAADVVVDYARPKVPSRSGRARRSVRSRSTRTEARVIGGGKRVPYYPWLDFGGKVGKGRSISRPFITDGRYIYAGFYAKRDKFEDVMVKGLLDVARQAGIEVDGG